MLTTSLAVAMWQQDAVDGQTAHLIMIFIGIAALALLAQAFAMASMAYGAAKAQKAIMVHVESLNGKLHPLLDKSNALIADLGPQIKDIAGHAKSISANAEEISALVRDKVNDFGPTIDAANRTVVQANMTVQDANRKTQAQVERVNGMVSSVLDATAQAGRVIQNGITTPVREVSSILEGIKAGVLTFINRGRR